MICLPFPCRRMKVVETQTGEGESRVRTYTYKELRDITANFSIINKIGQGGFGHVYKGKFKDGTVVAVKVLSTESKQGAQEFKNELDVISKVVHQNLVRLVGCCVEGDHRILVYDYHENNSLARTLLGNGDSNVQFDWPTRTMICIGVARGLAYLHETVRPHIVHRDIKASNILLDKKLNPKISDFGLAKLIPVDMTHVSTRVAGTFGYLAPEYAIRGHLTRRADIYSFGVLLLEIVTGRCNTNTMLPSGDCFLLERTWLLHERDDLLSIVDTFLDDKFDKAEATRILQIGLLCTQEAPKQRPTMSEVVKMLTGEKEVNVENITKPGLISDFTDLKIKKWNREGAKSPTTSYGLDNSSAETTNISFSFNPKSDQDE